MGREIHGYLCRSLRICGTKLRNISGIGTAIVSDDDYGYFPIAPLNNTGFYQKQKVITDALSGPGRRSLFIIHRLVYPILLYTLFVRTAATLFFLVSFSFFRDRNIGVVKH